MPSPPPKDFAEEAHWILGQSAVRAYYEERYPILLPRLYRLRLEGWLRLFEDGEPERAHRLYVKFLGLVNHVRDDPEIELFQWFLDSGYSGGRGLPDTLWLLQDPERTLETLLKDPAKRSTTERSASGAQKFLTFCGVLDGLLHEADGLPLLRSAMWTYYSYWFDLIWSEVGTRLHEILGALLRWSQEAPRGNLELKKELESSISGLWEAVKAGDSDSAVRKQLDAIEILNSSRPEPDREMVSEYVRGSKEILARLLSSSNGEPLRRAAEAHS